MIRTLFWKRQSLLVGAVAAATVVAATSFSATAADDPIAARKSMMQTVKAAAQVSGAIVKGEMPYDAKSAVLALRAINSVATGIVNFFPEDSKTGGKTTVSPKIWEDMAGFKAKMAKFQTDSAAGIKSAEGGADAFKAAWDTVSKNCKGCHQDYRIKKKE